LRNDSLARDRFSDDEVADAFELITTGIFYLP